MKKQDLSNLGQRISHGIRRNKDPIVLIIGVTLLLGVAWWFLNLPESEPDPNYMPVEVDDSTVAYDTIWVQPVAVKWSTGGYTYLYYAGTSLTLKGHIDIIPGNVYKIVYKSYSVVSVELID